MSQETDLKIQWPWPDKINSAENEQLQEAILRLENRSNKVRDEKLDDKWLLDLHRDATSMFVHENNRIWTTGSIFIAIAFTSFSISSNPLNPSLQFLAGLTSVALLFIWNLIADKQRIFQDRHRFWIEAIDGYFLGEKVAPKVIEHGAQRFYFRLRYPFKIRFLRWSLFFVLLIAVVMRWQFAVTAPQANDSPGPQVSGSREGQIASPQMKNAAPRKATPLPSGARGEVP